MKINNNHTINLLKTILKRLAPPPNLTIHQWADRFRVLSKESSAEPGKWKTEVTPYMIEILETIADKKIKISTLMTSAQVGKSETLNNVFGYYAHLDPSPIIFIQPTVEMAQSYSRERIAPMIRDTPVLARIFENPRKRDSGNTVSKKSFPGGYVVFVGANSPSSLASRPIKIVLADEIDRFPVSAGKEGDPLELVEKRTTTFWDSKKIRVSTPTIQGISRIEKSYNESSMEVWCLPCPACGHLNELDFERIKWEDLNEVVMECEECGSYHDERAWKKEKQLNGKWVSKNPNIKDHRGFHLNEFASPWKTWNEIIDDYKQVKDDPERLITFWNTSLGLPFVINLNEIIDYEILYNRRENYKAEVPAGSDILTAGIDVQDNRIETEVVAWNQEGENWGIEYKIFPGNPELDDVWNDLKNYLAREFEGEDGTKKRLSLSFIDTGGHHTDRTYDFVNENIAELKVIGIKGRGGEGVSVHNGFRRTKCNKIDLLSLGVNALKDMTYASLKIDTPGPKYCHFPLDLSRGYGADYFKMLTSEVKEADGKTIVWKKIRDRNEALDIRNYARAAFEMVRYSIGQSPQEDERTFE
ncbi:phage terminase large subunit family protein [Ilyobacter polytropus]|uniref:Terminase GpA n=1 Tax=Ilyobacter polytropus (strain ATCC 51220 / DSM 2926 / LMG 16218 / CuHBu1) TaxID=572544 RepID=E3HBM7_ILYPC|nr:phage terminase large subunit family protein [Ilyobacter polytropus]ADO83723.1 terminase GpA [Ilyobacter polytropus DSM 2926]